MMYYQLVAKLTEGIFLQTNSGLLAVYGGYLGVIESLW